MTEAGFEDRGWRRRRCQRLSDCCKKPFCKTRNGCGGFGGGRQQQQQCGRHADSQPQDADSRRFFAAQGGEGGPPLAPAHSLQHHHQHPPMDAVSPAPRGAKPPGGGAAGPRPLLQPLVATAALAVARPAAPCRPPHTARGMPAKPLTHILTLPSLLCSPWPMPCRTVHHQALRRGRLQLRL